ncbi:hypothetical protein JCM5353_004248 [Sporobolomyces roseus]
MPVRIRLSRTHLTRNSPHYTLIATPSTSRPTAQPLELLGYYSPLPVPINPIPLSPNGQQRDPSLWGPGMRSGQEGTEKGVRWNEERVKYWLSLGAKPSKTVERLLNQAGIIKSEMIPKPTTTNSKGLVVSRSRRIRDAVRFAEKERGEIPVAQRKKS